VAGICSGRTFWRREKTKRRQQARRGLRGGELGVNAVGGNIEQGSNRHLRERGKFFEGWKDILHMRATVMGRKAVPKAKAYPVSNMYGGVNATSQPVACLLGEQCSGPGGDGGEAEAAL
jgi:hypothetical protein